ncbi:MAG TPA: hypothetical protein ENJ01_06365 [Gammaproteobacteria bacterium]|nr:hypothetical protein [Gammaproteobacteria bacterium]
MATPFEPVVGQWYQDMEQRVFQVLDADIESIEVQYADGEIEEFDVDTWYVLELHPAVQPMEWSDLLQDYDKDDLVALDLGMELQ